jgi:hypothetical protein
MQTGIESVSEDLRKQGKLVNKLIWEEIEEDAGHHGQELQN